MGALNWLVRGRREVIQRRSSFILKLASFFSSDLLERKN